MTRIQEVPRQAANPWHTIQAGSHPHAFYAIYVMMIYMRNAVTVCDIVCVTVFVCVRARHGARVWERARVCTSVCAL